MIYQTLYPSPIGSLLLQATDEALTVLQFDGILQGDEQVNSIVRSTVLQLDEYFARSRRHFDIPLSPEGTEFQQKVWKQLITVEYGRQLSYLQLSKRLGNVLAIRAVANANGKNPIPIMIPCHRVVGSKGDLIGFSGGLWRKQFLLELEGNRLF